MSQHKGVKGDNSLVFSAFALLMVSLVICFYDFTLGSILGIPIFLYLLAKSNSN